MSKKLIASLMIATLLVSNTLYAQAPAAKNTTTNVAVTNNQKQDTKQIAEIKGTLLTLDEAISQGLENSLVLQQVRNQADIAKLVGSNGEEVRNNLNESTMALSHASYVINDGRDQIYEKQPQLESAQAALERGMSPATVSKEFQGVTFNFKAGNTIMDDVVDSLAAHVLPVYPGATMEQVRSLVKDKAEALYPTVVEALKQYVSGLSDELAVSQKKIRRRYTRVSFK
ncbi:hypothetical protein [Cellulosilyticum ruminicola]|uniref:hypothetical protein n=1 Tax=Cellulosilyticum ruminicola TaxID=425254 RepID=UPI0006D1F75F|nr:hypothetical protein [Cellulosilyticum ruminicola]